MRKEFESQYNSQHLEVLHHCLYLQDIKIVNGLTLIALYSLAVIIVSRQDSHDFAAGNQSRLKK